LYRVLLAHSCELLNNSKQLDSISVVSRTKLTCVQANRSCNLNDCFLFVVVVVVVVAIVVIFASILALALVFAFVFFASTFIFFASLASSLASLLSIVILLALVALFDSFLDCNIKRICESKEIETRLTIYNSDLILSLRVRS